MTAAHIYIDSPGDDLVKGGALVLILIVDIIAVQMAP
jgi:hypothetical protein